MIDDEFEWDDGKAITNYAKHGVKFEGARLVFKDIFAIEVFDDSEAYREERFSIIGVSDGRLLFVVYTMRGERIRIISARGAEPYEQREYHEQNGQFE